MRKILYSHLFHTTKLVLLAALLLPAFALAAKFSTKQSQAKSSLASRSFIESTIRLKVSKEFQQSFWQQIYGNAAPSDIDFGVEPILMKRFVQLYYLGYLGDKIRFQELGKNIRYSQFLEVDYERLEGILLSLLPKNELIIELASDIIEAQEAVVWNVKQLEAEASEKEQLQDVFAYQKAILDFFVFREVLAAISQFVFSSDKNIDLQNLIQIRPNLLGLQAFQCWVWINNQQQDKYQLLKAWRPQLESTLWGNVCLTRIFHESGERERAKELIQNSFALSEVSKRLIEIQLEIAKDIGNKALLLQLLEVMENKGIQNASLFVEKAKIAPDPKQKLQNLYKAIDLEPQNMQAYILSLPILEKAGQADIALKLFLRLDVFVPNNSYVLETIGNLYDSLGQRQKALNYWQKAELVKPK